MNKIFKKEHILMVALLSFLFLPLFSPATDAADHLITYPSFVEEFHWTYGCTPTAASMVLSYWDTSHWDREHRWKYIGMGKLIDYYYGNQCSGYNVPNTIDELWNALGTDYNRSTCEGDGETDPWDIDDGIQYVTNHNNGYTFFSTSTCQATWPEIIGDWCWEDIKWEIDAGRPFVWSTGDLGFFETSGHSVAAWGYTDSKYVIIYSTWGGGREDWYYSYYLNDADNDIASTKVNALYPPNTWERDESDIILDDPTGGEKLFSGTPSPIIWYQWGTRVQTVKIFLSLDSGRSWSFLSSWDTPYNPNPGSWWGGAGWIVPDTPSDTARIRVEAFDSADLYIAGDGSFGDFRIIRDSTPPTGSIIINGGASTTNNPSVTLSLSCVDNPNAQGNPGPDGIGCADMRFSNDNSAWTVWEAVGPNKTWTLSGADGAKTVFVQFRDKVGNISSTKSDSITLDRTGPQAAITVNNGAAFTTIRSVTINISCMSGDCVQMRFSEYHNPVWTSWEPYAPTKPWTLSGSSGGQKLVYAHFRDSLGNISSTSDMIILDEVPPYGGITIQSGTAYTNTLTVNLSLSCQDYESGCAEMRFSNDNIVWTPWEPFASPRTWSLVSGEGRKTIFVQYRDNVGRQTDILSDTIDFEITPPSGSVSINSQEPSTNSTSAILTLACTDSYSGCAQMRVSNDNNIWTEWEPFAASKPWTLTAGNGTKRVYVQYRDAAGNIATFSDTITLETLFLLSTIDAPLSVGIPSIAADSNGKVHISSPGGALRYVTNASGSWVITYVDKWANYSSIALDSFNAAHISYYDSSNKILKYATNSGGNWVTAVVDATGDVGWYSSIALDSNNKVHIAYYDSTNDDLKYATNSSGSWSTSTLDSAGDVGKYSSIGVDSNNRVHISYHDATNVDLKYITNASGDWAVSVLESYNTMGAYSSLALDSNDKVHISYRGDVSGILKYITNASGPWVAEVVEATRGENTSISVDSSHHAHIVYYDSNNYGLKYASKSSGSWVISAIGNAGNMPRYPSIAVDGGNIPHIAYMETTAMSNCELRYAENSAGSWSIDTVESAANPSGNTSIAVDSNGHIHISYLYLYEYHHPILLDWEINYGLKYATNASGVWVKSIIDDGSFTDAPTSIAIDSNNRVHISYYKNIRYPVDHRLMYVTNASGPWVVSPIDSSTTQGVGTYSSLAIDSNDKAHLAYGSTTSGPLTYATNASGSWVKTPIAAATGNEVSISLDSVGNAHLAYRNSANGLGYATNASGSWVVSAIDPSGGSSPSIAVDGENHVHISHIYFSGYPTAYGALEYANNVSGSWSLSTVDNTGNAWNTAIKTDSNNRAHIAYFDILGLKLKYATNVSGSWLASTIDDDGDTGRYPSIAVDSNDMIHLGYFGGGLKYGRSPDTSPPQGSFTINGGANYSNSGSVSLVLSALDPSGVAQMCISETPSCTTWEPYSPSKIFDLSSGDGLKTIYVWFRDGQNNPTAIPYTATITLDTAVPSAPTGFRVDGPMVKGLRLSWNANPELDAVRYRIRYGTASGSYTQSVETGNVIHHVLPGLTPKSRYYLVLSALDHAGNESPLSSEINGVAGGGMLPDFDGDGRTDIAIYREAWGAWYIQPSGGGDVIGLGWGGDPSDIPVPGDYDGDGKTDVAIYRKSSGAWWVIPSSTGTPYGVGFGGRSTDIPVPGDYDGDGRTDIAIYRQEWGAWYITPSGGGDIIAMGWGGGPTDIPVPGDYDGDGKTDVAIYRAENGAWWIIPSTTGTPYGVGHGGGPTDIPVPGDYDGDGKMDIAIYRQAWGAWYIQPSAGGNMIALGWGGDPTDIPVPGDYDGDGKADVAIYRKSSGAWWIIPSSTGAPYGIGFGGDPTDIPVIVNPALRME